MAYLLTCTLTDPSDAWQLWHQVEVPPPLCSTFDRPNMSDVIAAHSSRFVAIKDRNCLIQTYKYVAQCIIYYTICALLSKINSIFILHKKIMPLFMLSL